MFEWVKNIINNKSLSNDEKILRLKEIELIAEDELSGNEASFLYYSLGSCYLKSEKFIDAIRFLDKAYFFYKGENEHVELTGILLRLGMTYGKTGNYSKAIDCLQICYDEAMKENDMVMASNVINNLGSVHYSISNFEKAISSYKQGLKIKREIGDNENLSLIILNIAKCYLDLQNYKNAKDYAIVCLNQLFTYRDDSILGETYVVLGLVHFHKEKFDIAEEYYDKAISIFEKRGNKEWLIICYENYALNYINKGNPEKGLEYLRKCEMMIDKHLEVFREHIYESYSTAYTVLEDYKTALEYYQKFHSLKSKRLDEDTLRSINELEISYKVEHEKQKAEIERLRNVELVRLNEEKNEFLGLVAHDLKNPLSSILLSVSHLKRNIARFSQEDIIKRLEKTEAVTNKMQEIIKHLLDVNAIERGDYNLKPEDVNAVGAVNEIIEEMQEQIVNKKISFNVESNGDVMIKSDKIAFREIISNLLSNAVKYSYPGSPVTVKIYKQEEKKFIEVIDCGLGIKENEMKNIFKKFAKTSNKPTAGESSTGLGLSIVKKLTELMGGEIHAESEEGKGSKFILKF
ncbi:MAG: tetratricopeptide repeat-containing sensor histidine kinase [Ignavibacteria bacterium]|nr:tetratricopeptide repeat-containing sensor histidine kinase [Ignavibacteria bacterium]